MAELLLEVQLHVRGHVSVFEVFECRSFGEQQSNLGSKQLVPVEDGPELVEFIVLIGSVEVGVDRSGR